jgi:hypothetical protein
MSISSSGILFFSKEKILMDFEVKNVIKQDLTFLQRLLHHIST